MATVLDEPAVVLICVTIAAVLFVVEAALPTMGLAGTGGVIAAVAGAVGIARQDAPWWPLVGPALATVVWSLLVVARRRWLVGELAAVIAYGAGGVGFAALSHDVAAAATAIASAIVLSAAYPPLQGAAARLLDAPPQVGMEALVGLLAVVDRWTGDRGVVLLHGTRWNATCEHGETVTTGQRVVVVATHGNTLVIRC